MSRRVLRVPAVTLLLLVAAAPAAPAQTGPPETVEGLALSSDLRVQIRAGREIVLLVLPEKGAGWAAVARRVAGGAARADAIAAWNDATSPREGEWVRVPFRLLSADYRRLVLSHLFPRDERAGEDWIHIARAGALPVYDEGLWQVAEWFTGDGNQFSRLLEANDLNSPELVAGQRIRIPASLLDPALAAAGRSDDGSLVYASDADGPYAGYDLKTGEALYSAVVVRFTGRTLAEDVIETAQQLARRSGIDDLTDIPVGYRIKVPLDLLEPQFLPPSHPRRREAEEARRALVAELERQPVAETRGGLRGVLVVLDPGHGGRDLGTQHNGIWEHDYVYDVACRLKQKLERETAATVVMTLEDKQTGFAPSTGDKLKKNFQGHVLTTPPFLATKEGEAAIGVNLRWYLANSVYRRALKEGVAADRILFVSLHADARHPSLRGVMVYLPGAAYRTRTYGHSASIYRKYKEVQEKPQVRFGRHDRVRSEAVSNKFADAIVAAFEEEKLPVQSYQPVRNRIIRGRSKWVPAVLRGNAIPNKVLVEMVNLSNAEDAALLGRARDRDRLAGALARALFRYFGESPPESIARLER